MWNDTKLRTLEEVKSTMNLVDFLIYSPISIWALVCAIIFSTVMLVRVANKLIAGQEKISSALSKDNGKVHETTEELRKDTIRLQSAVLDVHKSIAALVYMLRKIYFWIPISEDKEK